MLDPTSKTLNYVFLFNIICMLTYGYAVVWHLIYKPTNDDYRTIKFSGGWKYLTFWNLVIQFLLGLLSVCNQVFKNSKISKKICFIRDILHHGLGTPVALFVTSTFWLVYGVNRELILPVEMETNYPYWLNQLSHTIVSITALTSELIQYHRRSTYHSLRLLIIVLIIYLSLILYLGIFLNQWIYIVLEVMENNVRFAFISLLCLVLFSFYLLTGAMHTYRWGTYLNRSINFNKVHQD